MEVDLNVVKELRQKTGAGVMAVKKALDESNGDADKAEEILKKQGLANALKKSGRETSEGVVQSYIHAGNKIGSLVELKCETDFVARTDDFVNLAKDLAMQVAAMGPLFISKDDEAADSPFGDDGQPYRPDAGDLDAEGSCVCDQVVPNLG